MKNSFFLVGPTASGKTELAAEVAAALDAEIISADAFQIYHGLPLLTAQPNEAILRRAPHHLVDAIPLTDQMTAAKFRSLALTALAEISRRGKRALVVGGSGLYVKALTHGLAPLPPIDQELRTQLDALSLEDLNTRLAAVDPSGAETIDRKNKRRVVRALEIFAQTGRPSSAQRAEWQQGASTARGVLVFRERQELNARIDARVEEMFREGVVEEVGRVQWLSETAAKTLGFAEIRRLLAAESTEPECIAAIQQATRQYAKRQLTWFRRQTNFEPLNLSLIEDHAAAVDWILQKAKGSFASAE